AQLVTGVERDLGKEKIDQLARTDTEITELQKELLAARQRGEASERLFELLSKVDPQIGREMVLEAQGRPMSRNQARKAWRALQSRLKAQARTETFLQMTRPPPARAKAAAWVGLILEAWELAEPFIDQAVQSSRDTKREDFYRFFRDLMWRSEKGLNPYMTGRTDPDSPDLAENAPAPGIWKRTLEDLPEDQRKKQEEKLKQAQPELSKAVEQAKALRLLYIPEMNKWPKERRDAFWSSLTVWTSAHIKNYDDYASELLETPISPIRQVEEEGKGFGERKWQIRVGILDSGHVLERWQDSEDLTRIMNATIKRVVATTQKELAARWEKRAPAV